MTGALSPLEHGSVRALVGGVVWAGGVVYFTPSPFDPAWAVALLLLAALVLLPVAMDLVGRDGVEGASAGPFRLAALLQLPAALCLAGAFLLPQGPGAAALAVPWLIVTGLLALCGLLRIGQQGVRPVDRLCIDAGLVYVVVGSAWAVSDRLGYRPLQFDPIIVLLTAVHFHYAGFVLPIVTGLAVRQVSGRAARAAGIAVLAGVPMVAVGITTTQLGASPLIESAATLLMAAGGAMVAWLHLRLSLRYGRPTIARPLWAVAAVSLFATMVLAVLYGWRFYLPVAWLDIPHMRVTHGTANALAFALPALLAWSSARRSE